MYATSRADTPFGDFKWTNEYAVFVSFTEDGEQINKVEEMVDTAFYQEFFPKFQRYMSGREALSVCGEEGAVASPIPVSAAHVECARN